MSATTLAAMIIEDIKPRFLPSLVAFQMDPASCEHLWEPHLWEIGGAYCARCGSLACWRNDPRAAEVP